MSEPICPHGRLRKLSDLPGETVMFETCEECDRRREALDRLSAESHELGLPY